MHGVHSPIPATNWHRVPRATIFPPCRNDDQPRGGPGMRRETGRSNMNQLVAVAFGGLAMLAAAATHGQERTAPSPDAGYTVGTGPASGGASPGEPRAAPLFNFGGLDVGVWAPVEPPYSTDGDRDPAGESFWSMNEFRRATSFRTVRLAGAAPSLTPAGASVATLWE
jgi:hypothetical protein